MKSFFSGLSGSLIYEISPCHLCTGLSIGEGMVMVHKLIATGGNGVDLMVGQIGKLRRDSHKVSKSLRTIA